LYTILYIILHTILRRNLDGLEVMSEQTAETKNSNLSSDIAATLKEQIIRWEYLPGHRFTEEELCQKFSVSRSPVREALHMLAKGKEMRSGGSVRAIGLRVILKGPFAALPCCTITGPFQAPTERFPLSGNR
jgi:hypothetical protein